MAKQPDQALISDAPWSVFEPTQWREGVSAVERDYLAEETPVALIYNGVSHAVMLATAQDLEEFALGFSLSEGIIQAASELYAIEVMHQSNGIELHCEIASDCFARLKERRRTLAGKTGCGLCGAESLQQAVRFPDRLLVTDTFSSAAVQYALTAMTSQQQLQQKTGATHACAYALNDGTIFLLREDVGRHNALDKLVGALAKAKSKQSLPEAGFIITTSRASFEMVQKTVTAGVAMLVAVSAPTGLAVRVAEQAGLCLVGFARKDRYVVYSHGERMS